MITKFKNWVLARDIEVEPFQDKVWDKLLKAREIEQQIFDGIDGTTKNNKDIELLDACVLRLQAIEIQMRVHKGKFSKKGVA
jgi:hypothetical protein